MSICPYPPARGWHARLDPCYPQASFLHPAVQTREGRATDAWPLVDNIPLSSFVQSVTREQPGPIKCGVPVGGAGWGVVAFTAERPVFQTSDGQGSMEVDPGCDLSLQAAL